MGVYVEVFFVYRVRATPRFTLFSSSAGSDGDKGKGLGGISVQGVKDTLKPEDSASNVHVNKAEEEVDWNEEGSDSDVDGL